MSEENVETVRRALEALDRRDLTSWLAVNDEDFEVVPSREWPEPGVRGAEAAFNWYVQAFDTFEPFRTADTEFIDAGADKVLLQYRMDLRGRGSGAKFELRRWCVATIRKGRGLRTEWFTDRAEALEAAGLAAVGDSEGNVKIARQAFDAFNRTFNEGTADLYELLDAEVEWVPMTAILEGTRFHGHDGVRQWVEEMKREWTTFEVRPERFLDLGDQVLVMGTWRAQGRGSGVQLDFPQATWLTQYRKGRVVLLQTFTDREEALEAAGLRE